jgi:hypothetical protein
MVLVAQNTSVLRQRTYGHRVPLVCSNQQLPIFLQQAEPLLVIPPDRLHDEKATSDIQFIRLKAHS